jgi:hypothetical protein
MFRREFDRGWEIRRSANHPKRSLDCTIGIREILCLPSADDPQVWLRVILASATVLSKPAHAPKTSGYTTSSDVRLKRNFRRGNSGRLWRRYSSFLPWQATPPGWAAGPADDFSCDDPPSRPSSIVRLIFSSSSRYVARSAAASPAGRPPMPSGNRALNVPMRWCISSRLRAAAIASAFEAGTPCKSGLTVAERQRSQIHAVSNQQVEGRIRRTAMPEQKLVEQRARRHRARQARHRAQDPGARD